MKYARSLHLEDILFADSTFEAWAYYAPFDYRY